MSNGETHAASTSARTAKGRGELTSFPQTEPRQFIDTAGEDTLLSTMHLPWYRTRWVNKIATYICVCGRPAFLLSCCHDMALMVVDTLDSRAFARRGHMPRVQSGLTSVDLVVTSVDLVAW